MDYKGCEIDILEEESGFFVNVYDETGLMVYEAYEFEDACDAEFHAKNAVDDHIEHGVWPS